MLAKSFSLSGKKEFDNVLKNGTFIQSNSFGFVYLNRNDEHVSRFGFIVSTKVAKEAVLRNRVKRALSETIRFSMSKIKKGYNVVFLAKGQSTKTPTDELMKETENVLLKAKLIQ